MWMRQKFTENSGRRQKSFWACNKRIWDYSRNVSYWAKWEHIKWGNSNRYQWESWARLNAKAMENEQFGPNDYSKILHQGRCQRSQLSLQINNEKNICNDAISGYLPCKHQLVQRSYNIHGNILFFDFNSYGIQYQRNVWSAIKKQYVIEERCKNPQFDCRYRTR